MRFKPVLPNRNLAAASILALAAALPTQAQTAAPLPEAPAPTVKNLPLDVLKDQRVIWTAPLRIRTRDLLWLVPLAGAAAATIATDNQVETTVVSRDAGFNQANTNVSNVLIGGFAATPAVLYGWGHFKADEHAREAGLLGAEALADGVVVEQGLKLVFLRERPFQDRGRGLFFQTGAGANGSFPSSHSTLAWATAAVLAQEYPSHWKQAGVYTLASAVSVTRVLGQQHFPTDVLVGGAAGWFVGHYVAKKHPWRGSK